MIEGLAPADGPPACVKATFCIPGEQKQTKKTCLQPFSSGLVTVMVPQLRRENSLLLWSTLDLNSPVHAFVGHDDVVLEFQWRPQKEGEQRRRSPKRGRLPPLSSGIISNKIILKL